MIFELVHTYAARGLRGEPAGFSTVACTAGLPGSLRRIAEQRSGYPLGRDDRATTALRAVTDASGERWLLLSRVVPCAPTPHGLANRCAHHLLIDPRSVGDGAPGVDLAALLCGVRFRDAWAEPPREFPGPPDLAAIAPDESAAPASIWARDAGDAGWAGIVLERLEAFPTRPLSILLPAGTAAAPLAADLMRLLPASLRREITFSDRPEDPIFAGEARLLLLDETTLDRFGPPPLAGPTTIDLRSRPHAGDSPAAQRARGGDRPQMRSESPTAPRFGAIEPPRDESAPPAADPGPIEVALEDAPPRRVGVLALAGAAAILLAAIAWLAIRGGSGEG